MNGLFATTALVIGHGGRLLGYLDGHHLAFPMAQDSGRLLKTLCGQVATKLEGSPAA